MAIIIRLQNLPLEANSLDIRRFFQGLQIPDGGVHIVGGENGDAFIGFAGDEDARQAMERNGETIKECRVKLLLSSRNEMQRVIDSARSQTLGLKTIDTAPANPNSSSAYLNASLMTSGVGGGPAGSPMKSSELRLRSRSPDRRPAGRQTRSIERERINVRNRSRSRSPYRDGRDKNGTNAGLMDRMGAAIGSMALMRDSVRDGQLGQSSFGESGNASIRSRLGYADAILPVGGGLQDNLSRNHWPPPTDSAFNRVAQTADLMPGSGDFDRDLELYRDNRLIPNHNSATLSDRSYTVEMRNLPFNIVVRDICDFFRGLYVPEENVKILIDDRGLTTGGALVRFNNERDFDAALSTNNRFLGDRRIDVQPLLDNFPIDRSDLMLYQPPSQLAPPSQSKPIDDSRSLMNHRTGARGGGGGGREYVLYMKGLPYSNCTERDVIKFFEPIRLKDIVIETDPKGKPTGNAFVEFHESRDYESGYQLNMKHMGRRYIELLPTTREDMSDGRRGGPARGGGGVGGGPLERGSRAIVGEIPPQKTFCVNVTGLPATVTNRDLTHYFSQFGAQPYAIHIMLSPDGLNAGEAYVEFVTPDYQYLALQRDGEFIGNSRIGIKPVPYEVMKSVVGKPPMQLLEPPPPPRNVSTRALRSGRHDEHFRPSHKRDREEKRGSRGGDPFADSRCVVIATNIPYRASTEDICVFFSDFGITEGCVSRRFNEKGQPTADARIAFHTPDDASRAVKLMHKKFLIGRPVFLKSAT